MVNSSALVRATGFSKAISFAPPSIAALIIGVRRLGSVQKQNTSGFTALASAAASVPFCGLPSLAAASSRRFGSMSQMPVTWNLGLALKAVAWCMPRLPMPTTRTEYLVITE